MTSAPDDVLELLRQRGRHPDPSALDSLMRGVAAAPEGLAGPEWVELVDPQADAELTKALTAWRAELAKADDGLDAVPAPASRLAALRAELKRRDLARLRRAARRRTSGRIRAAPLAAAGLAHRLQRLGRPRHRAGRPRGDLHRRALHAGGAQPGRHRRLRAAPDPGAIAGGVDRRQPAQGRQARLRSLAADGRRPRALCARLPARRRRIRAGRFQSGRRGVARPAAGAAGAGPAASRRIRRREQRGQAQRASPAPSRPRAPTWR